MSSYILQARQKNSNTVLNNGNYTTILKENANLRLDKGDSVLLKSCFIDTQETNSGKIVINEDLDLFINYFMYDVLDDETHKTFDNATTSSDGKPYFLYYAKGAEIPTGYTYLEYFTLKVGKVGTHWIEYDGTINYEYIDTNGNTIKASVNMPATRGDRTTQPIYTRIILKEDSFKITKYNIDPEGANPREFTPHYIDIPEANHYEPVMFSNRITLEAGEYTPTHIASVINQKMTNGKNGISQDTLLKLSTEYDIGYGAEYRFLNEDATNFYTYQEPTADVPVYLLGSSQFAMNYDSEKNKFIFQYLHTPHYKGGGGADSGSFIVEWKNPTENGTPNLASRYMLNKRGGMMLNSLEPADFWIDKLGLDLTQGLPQFTHIEKEEGGINFKYNAFNNVAEGVNITGGFYSMDDYIDKEQTDPKIYDNGLFKNSTQDTFIIYSDKQFLSGNSINNPYFIVEMNIGDNRLYTENGIINLSGICSRYYGYNNFTSSGEEAGLLYTHNSDISLVLNKIRIRILNPDLTESQELGEENTVFLQVLKKT